MCVCARERTRARACAGGLVPLACTLARTLAGMHSRACVDMPSAMPVCTDMPSAMPTCCRHSQSAGAASARGSMPKCAPFNTVASWTDVFAVVIPLTTPKSHNDNSPIRRHQHRPAARTSHSMAGWPDCTGLPIAPPVGQAIDSTGPGPTQRSCWHRAVQAKAPPCAAGIGPRALSGAGSPRACLAPAARSPACRQCALVLRI